MDRLTFYDGTGTPDLICCMECGSGCGADNENCGYCDQTDEAYARLAAFEDIGLEPEEIINLQKVFALACRVLADEICCPAAAGAASFTGFPECENEDDPCEGHKSWECWQRWTSAVMLDGGGSSQCDFTGKKITSSREVHNLILVYLEKQKKVCLDPGHGVETAGKRSPDGTYLEHEFNLDMAKRMKPMLERHNVEVTLTRADEHDVTLAKRVAAANAVRNLDLFVSLHTNAAGNDGWYSAKGLTCYTSAAGDSAGRNKAAKAMLSRFKESGIALRGTPLVHTLYYVLKNTVAPAVLVEHGFHTNREETELLKASAYRDKLAEAEAKGILDYLGIPWQGEDYSAAVQARFGLGNDVIAYLTAYANAKELLKALATKE